MQRPEGGATKGAVAFANLLNVSVSAGSLLGLPGSDSNGRKRFVSTTHPRKWLRINENGKLNYITVATLHVSPVVSCVQLRSLYNLQFSNRNILLERDCMLLRRLINIVWWIRWASRIVTYAHWTPW